MWRSWGLILLVSLCGSLAQVSTDVCEQCFIEAIPAAGLTIGWAEVEINTITVATATVVIDTVAGLTSTVTAPVATITADGEGHPILDDDALEKFWSSQVRPASALQEVNVVDGTPTATVTAGLAVGPASTTVVTGTIVWPAKYERYGLAISSYNANTCSRPRITLASTVIGLQPTVTDATYSNPYDYPLHLAEWRALLPPHDCSVLLVAGTTTGIAITQARAITDTVTSYGVFANRQEPTTTPAASSSGENNRDEEQTIPTADPTAETSAQGTGSAPSDSSGDVGGNTPSSVPPSTTSPPTFAAGACTVHSSMWLVLVSLLTFALA